jgi:hypothetical protein
VDERQRSVQLFCRDDGRSNTVPVYRFAGMGQQEPTIYGRRSTRFRGKRGRMVDRRRQFTRGYACHLRSIQPRRQEDSSNSECLSGVRNCLPEHFRDASRNRRAIRSGSNVASAPGGQCALFSGATGDRIPSDRCDGFSGPLTPHYPSSLRSPPAIRTRPPFPRAATIYDRVARHSKRRFYPRAKKSRSNFPRFDFSKRGFCARLARKNTPEYDPRFRPPIAHKTRENAYLPRSVAVFPCGFPPPKQGETRFRPFSQSVCDNRATNPRLVQGSHFATSTQPHPHQGSHHMSRDSPLTSQPPSPAPETPTSSR